MTPRTLSARSRVIRWALLYALWVGSAGCATLVPKLQAPQLSLTAVALRSGTLQRQQFELSVHAINPNPRAIAIAAVEVHVDLAGTPFADGTTQAPFTLPAHGAADFTLEVSTQLANAMVALAANQAHRAVDYRLYGQVKLRQGWLRTLPFDHNGRLQR